MIPPVQDSFGGVFMIWIPVGFAVYVLLLVMLLFVAVDDQRKKRRYTGYKMAVSTAFVVIFLVSYMATDRIAPADAPADAAASFSRAAAGLRPAMWTLLVPLLFCWGGDLLLGLCQQKDAHGRRSDGGAFAPPSDQRDAHISRPCRSMYVGPHMLRVRARAHVPALSRKKQLMAGAIVLFGAAHVLFLHYIGWFGLPWGWADFVIAGAAVALMIAVSVVGHMHMGRMRIPAYLYGAMISLLMARGLRLRFLVAGGPARAFASGTTYFFISDFLILFLYFYPFKNKTLKKTVHVLNLVTYYMGIFGMILGAVML